MNKVNSMTSQAEEQQAFRSGKSCTDVVFVRRQVTEESTEYNITVYKYSIDLEKTFDCLQFKDVASPKQ